MPANTAFLFPGQGSQYVGMGKALAEASPAASDIFEDADRITGRSIRALCYEGPEEALTQTQNTQVALLTVSVAAWRLLEAKGKRPAVVAGHSLGEYSALVASGAIQFEDALHVVEQRAHFMAEAAAEHTGGMVAILGLEVEQVQAICEEASSRGLVQPANINSPTQIVISGTPDGLAAAVELAQAQQARRCVPLPVSGAFHSPLMESAAIKLQAVLDKVPITAPSIPLIANVTGDYVSDPTPIRALLREQVTASVQWERTIRRMWDDRIQLFVEVGPKNVLSGLVKRTVRAAQTVAMDNPSDFAAYLETTDAT